MGASFAGASTDIGRQTGRLECKLWLVGIVALDVILSTACPYSSLLITFFNIPPKVSSLNQLFHQKI